MANLALIMISAAVVTFIATPLIRRLATRLGVIDQPSARKLHLSPVPLLGGVAIYSGLVAALFIGNTQPYFQELVGVMLGATVMTTLGVWDDSRGMKPVVKLAGQTLAGAALVMIAGIQVRLFDAQWLNVAITLFWVVGIANAVNFLDNMDGLAAGLASVAAGFFLILAVLEDLSLVAALSAATMGTCLGFLYYNFQPASLFMGDAGSLLLGYVLAVLGMKLEFRGRPLASTWMIPIIVLGLPIFDTTLVVVSRLRRRVPVYKGGKDHISHRLVSRLGLSQARAVVTLYYVATGLGMLSIIVRETQPLQASLIGGGLLIAFLGILVWAERGYEPEQAKPPSPKNDDTIQTS